LTDRPQVVLAALRVPDRARSLEPHLSFADPRGLPNPDRAVSPERAKTASFLVGLR